MKNDFAILQKWFEEYFEARKFCGNIPLGIVGLNCALIVKVEYWLTQNKNSEYIKETLSYMMRTFVYDSLVKDAEVEISSNYPFSFSLQFKMDNSFKAEKITFKERTAYERDQFYAGALDALSICKVPISTGYQYALELPK